jgi:hypothetical protein
MTKPMTRSAVAAAGLAVAAAAGLVGAARAQPGGTYYLHLAIPLEASAPWEVGEVWHLPWSDETDREPPLAEADARLVFRDAEGRTLHSRLVARYHICNGSCRETDSASVELPAQPDARTAELWSINVSGSPVERRALRTRSPAAPAVEILRPRAGDVIREGTLIEWRASDADGDGLTYNVLYRPSVGEWQQLPLASRITTTQLIFERSGLPADTNALIAIQANDGFNTTEASVGSLRLGGNLPPELYIAHPNDGETYRPGVSVQLVAYATDPEDGELPVRWSSSVDGPIADPDDWSTGTPGRHALTASATDSAGAMVSASITLYIRETFPPNVAFLPYAIR